MRSVERNMMNILKCDRCGQTQNVKTIKLWSGSHPDPSGNGYEDDYVIKDLCYECYVSFIVSNVPLSPTLANSLEEFCE